MRRTAPRDRIRNRRGRLADKLRLFAPKNARTRRGAPVRARKSRSPDVRASASLRQGAGLAGRRPKAPVSYLILTALVVAVVTGAFLFDLHVRFQAVQLGYRTSQARADQVRLLVERRALRLELASLKAPETVETEAREKLGMEMPDYRRIVPIGASSHPILASGKAQ